MERRSFLRSLLTLGAGIVVVGPKVLADVHRYIPVAAPPTNIHIMDALTKLTHDIYVTPMITPVRRYTRIQLDNVVEYTGRNLYFSVKGT